MGGSSFRRITTRGEHGGLFLQFSFLLGYTNISRLNSSRYLIQLKDSRLWTWRTKQFSVLDDHPSPIFNYSTILLQDVTRCFSTTLTDHVTLWTVVVLMELLSMVFELTLPRTVELLFHTRSEEAQLFALAVRVHRNSCWNLLTLTSMSCGNCPPSPSDRPALS